MGNSNRIIITPILAPYKIPLLALVAAYCSGILPKRSDAPLLALIVKIIEQHPLIDNNPISIDISVTELLDLIKSSLVSNSNSSTGNINGTASGSSALADYKVIESRLLNAVWSLRNLDALHQFITKANSLLVNTVKDGKEILSEFPKDLLPKKLLTKKSFLGRFVLNCIKDFEALEFEEIQKFWVGFVQFRQSSYTLFERLDGVRDVSAPTQEHYFGNDRKLNNLIQLIKQNASYSDLPDIDNDGISNNCIPMDKFKIISSYDLAQALSKQIRLLESYGTPTPNAMKETLKTMAHQGNNILPASYYLMYLECINASDYEGAFKSLHGYFDYMMSSNSQNYYQYALLSLATLHAKFNSNQLALDAIKEAIMVARENNDSGCLNYLLSWLFNFLKNRPELKHDFFESNEQLLEFLKKKTNQNSDVNISMSDVDLNSKAYQMEAVQIIIDGGPLNKILESVIKSGYLALNDDYDTGSFIINCCLQSSVWARVGIHDLAQLYAKISLDTSETQHNINNIYQSYFRLAWLEYERGNLEEVSRLLDVKGDQNLNTTTVTGLEVMKTIFEIKQSINKNRLTFARKQIEGLKVQESLTEIDLKNEIFTLEAFMEFKFGNHAKAIKILKQKIEDCEKDSALYNNYWYIKFNVLYCDIFSETNSSIRLLPTINKLIKLCDKSSLISVMNELIVILIRILLKMGKVKESNKLLCGCMPQILQYSSLSVQSQAYYLLAKTQYETMKRQGKLLKSEILNYLQLAINGYKKINDFFGLKQCFQLRVLFLSNDETMIDISEPAERQLEDIIEKMRQESIYDLIL